MTNDVTLPTPDEVAAMRERHVRYVDTDGNEWCGEPFCGDWPCDAARLLALVDATRWAVVPHIEEATLLRARLAAVLAECDRADADPLRPRQVHIDRIRRAATGEAP